MDKPVYCNVPDTLATAGKDIILSVWSDDGKDMLAISGQQSLTINRSADTIEVADKTSANGWKAQIPGMKEWSIDNDGLYIMSSDSHKTLGAAFKNDSPVCLLVTNKAKEQNLMAGLAFITDYPIEAPYDGAVTYTLTFSGNGELVDLTEEGEGTGEEAAG